MASTYSRLLRHPGALSFSAAGLIARFPMSMVGISGVLAVQATYGEYRAAGVVSAAGVIAAAVGSPLLARMVDAHGQRRVMVPATLVSAVGLLGLIVANHLHGPLWVLTLGSAVGGGFSGSMGSLTRSRWSNLLESPEDIHAAFSLEAALDETAFVIGPVLATTLCTSTVLPVESGWVASLLMQLVGAMWFLSQTGTEPPTRATRNAGRADPTDTPRSGVLRSGAVLVVVAVFLCCGMLFGANDVSVVARASEMGDKSAAGLLLACFGLGSLLAALVYGARSWTWPLWKQMLVGVAALALGCSTFLAPSSLVVLAGLMALAGMAVAPTITTGNSIVQVSVPSGSLTEGLAWVGTAINVGVSLGSFLAGVVLDAKGAQGGYLFVVTAAWVAVLVAAAGVPVLRRARPDPSQMRQATP